MYRILVALLALTWLPRPTEAEVTGGDFETEFERKFRGEATVLAATDRFLFVSDAGSAPEDDRPLGQQETIVRLLLCDRETGEIVHEFPGPVSRRPRVSGFGLPLTSPPLLLDDGFAFLTADWHLRRIKLPEDGAPAPLWDFDLPTSTRLTPRLSDDMGYLMPAITRCGDTLLITLNSAPEPDRIPVGITVVAVDLADGKLRWMRSLGSTGAIARSPTCVPAGDGKFHVATASGDVQTYSVKGDLQHAFRPVGEYVPSDPDERWATEVWQVQRIDDTQLLVYAGESPEFGSAVASPISCVSVAADGRMKQLWQSSKIRGSVAHAALGSSNFYLRSHDRLTAFELESGKELWSLVDKDPSNNMGWAPPVVHDGIVYLPHLDGLHLFRDGPDRALIGTLEFFSHRSKNRRSGEAPSGLCAPIIHGDSLYIAAGDWVYALELPLFP